MSPNRHTVQSDSGLPTSKRRGGPPTSRCTLRPTANRLATSAPPAPLGDMVVRSGGLSPVHLESFHLNVAPSVAPSESNSNLRQPDQTPSIKRPRARMSTNAVFPARRSASITSSTRWCTARCGCGAVSGLGCEMNGMPNFEAGPLAVRAHHHFRDPNPFNVYLY